MNIIKEVSRRFVVKIPDEKNHLIPDLIIGLADRGASEIVANKWEIAFTVNTVGTNYSLICNISKLDNYLENQLDPMNNEQILDIANDLAADYPNRFESYESFKDIPQDVIDYVKSDGEYE
jgi:hypothetical protein